MWTVVWAFVPFFALVALGWAASASRLIPREGMRHINTFVLYVSLPALVFQLAAKGALNQTALLHWLVVYGLAGIMLLLVACAWYVHRGMARAPAGLLGLATVFPNTGFLGLPLLTGLLGPQAAGPLMSTLLIDILLLSSAALAWAEGDGRQPGAMPAHTSGWRRVQGAGKNPLLWAMLAGLCVSGGSLSLPMPAQQALQLLGQSASPTALFALGGVLHGASSRSGRDSGSQGVMPAAVVFKLLLHPALVWLAAWGTQAQGWPMAEGAWHALVLAAALPSASNVLLLAERQAAQPARVARLIMATTGLSMATLVMWAMALSGDR